jgi:acrylyl-CoA reductase (NADPH)
MADTFKALILNERDGQVTAEIEQIGRERLPEGDVLVRVAYSGLNYKDGLALTGKNKVVRFYPMVPGIDFSGTVEESSSPQFKAGDQVVLTGWGVGERHWGGYAQYARVKSDWLVPLHAEIDLKQAMAIGTAGVTAMLAIVALEEHGMKPDGHEALVTGASGGVGSLAVAMLARLGYQVVAETGKPEMADYLKSLGAHEILDRAALAPSGGLLGSARWGGVVDTVGGEMLAGALRTLAYGASVAACGNAGGFEVNTTPFILRANNVLGIDSLPTPQARRIAIWNRIATDLPRSAIERTMEVIALEQARAKADDILAARTTGHLVVDVNA